MLEFVALLVLIGAVLYWGGARWGLGAEGFQQGSPPAVASYLSACPQGMNTFYLPDGRPACCDEDVVNDKCRYGMSCVMTGPGTPDMPNCTDIVNRSHQRKSNRLCPPSMRTYFEDPVTKTKGCTDGGLDETHVRPAHPTQPTCRIYPTLEENTNQADSCAIQKEWEETPCFGRGCSKTISPSTPPLITVQFQDDMGMYRTAYTRKSAKRYLDKNIPDWKEKGMFDLEKQLMIAEVAKAYYVDKTLTSKDIRI